MYALKYIYSAILNNNIGNVAINRGIFQGDALSPLLFVMCLFLLTDLLKNLNKWFLIDDIVVSHLLYLDDLKLYAKSSEDGVWFQLMCFFND